MNVYVVDLHRNSTHIDHLNIPAETLEDAIDLAKHSDLYKTEKNLEITSVVKLCKLSD